MNNLRDLTHENTRDYIGEIFQVRFSDGAVMELKLERVDLLMEKHVHSRMKRDAFTLQFRGPREVMLKQHIYPLHNEKFEEPLQMFLVPVAVEEEGVLYEAVFN